MSKSKTPLELAGRMARKSAALFRSIRHPGMAYFGDIGAGAVADAQAMASAAEREADAAIQIMDGVLEDGRLPLDLVRQLRRARLQVLRSARLDKQLAAGGVA